MSVVAHREVVTGTLSSRTRSSWRQLLLGCGIAFALLWIGMDVVASIVYDGYSYRDQTVSELSAIGAPTRPFWFALGSVWSALVIAFGVGVWQSAGPRRSLHLVSGLLIAYALITLTVGPFSSMHRREVLAAGRRTLSDTLHLVVTGFGVLTFLLEIGFAATAFGTWFRFYSIADDCGDARVWCHHQFLRSRGSGKRADALGWHLRAHQRLRLHALDRGAGRNAVEEAFRPRHIEFPIPNSQVPTNPNSQFPTQAAVADWELGVGSGWALEVGSWELSLLL
jgi:hypothetical protein